MTHPDGTPDLRTAIAGGATGLGIELGSTRIKACLVTLDGKPIAKGSHEWENRLADGLWTYSMDAVEQGLQGCYADLVTNIEQRYGLRPTTFGALGVSAMMHGYLPFDEQGELLVPFRTWRNTNTAVAAAELTELFGLNIPLRWSVAHYYQALLDAEPHLPRVAFLTTLAGYVHWRLTGRQVLGVGDASGMFPINSATHDFDAGLLSRFDEHLAEMGAPRERAHLADLLPTVLVAGQDAGRLTSEGARWLDPRGELGPGIALCPPEGDAGTGMVATNSVTPRTGNVSAGTSIFSMVVLERPLSAVHPELDLVTTPVGDPVAMVHCNNGASELNAWVDLFGQLSAALGSPAAPDAVFEAVFRAALDGESDAGGLVSYNYLAGEPITGLDAGRPLVVRAPDSRLTLANFSRSQIYAMFATLALGMRVLTAQGVDVDSMFAHGGIFKTESVAQRLLAAAIGTPVTVGHAAGEGGAWGIALLAAYLKAVEDDAGLTLGDYLNTQVFADAEFVTADPDPEDAAGFATYLNRYETALPLQSTAAWAIPDSTAERTGAES